MKNNPPITALCTCSLLMEPRRLQSCWVLAEPLGPQTCLTFLDLLCPLGPGLQPLPHPIAVTVKARHRRKRNQCRGSPGKALLSLGSSSSTKGPHTASPAPVQPVSLMALPMHQMERKTGRWTDGPGHGGLLSSDHGLGSSLRNRFRTKQALRGSLESGRACDYHSLGGDGR